MTRNPNSSVYQRRLDETSQVIHPFNISLNHIHIMLHLLNISMSISILQNNGDLSISPLYQQFHGDFALYALNPINIYWVEIYISTRGYPLSILYP